MTVRLNPYLSFRDKARLAMTFYQQVFGGELTVSTFADLHASEDPAEQEKVMHSLLEGANGLVLMAADTPNSVDFNDGAGYSISISGDDENTLRGYWDALSQGGTIGAPLEKAPWGDTFGTCTDKFGIGWMINITAV